mgnify:CR=1 FL=1
MDDEGLFEAYEQDLVTLVSSVNSKLQVDAREQRGGEHPLPPGPAATTR